MDPMRHPLRALAPLAVAVAVLPLAGCDSWSAKCDTDNTCKISIQGNDFYDFPKSYTSGKDLKHHDRIRLVSAKQGGEAVIQAGGADNRCTQGESFQVSDTTITCDSVGDDKVELTSTRP
ncbi:hypothetical protein NMQ01_13390 [Janibacter sp. CX7]|jgi:hypothetical protein|uniref:hypothetical protein n=1 Tax=unclassified Janibacter TaxID=2649294 RepID=UPI0020CD023A|nr:hypothetical protein [Janibacter sp. CX7]UTT65678.1 hypothetical protein NMQ01_13390 [Janibacter sp. CX7]